MAFPRMSHSPPYLNQYQLQIDIMAHRFTPPHVLVDRAKWAGTGLPCLPPNDIVARHLGAVDGDVVEITRPHPGGFHYPVHRRVGRR